MITLVDTSFDEIPVDVEEVMVGLRSVPAATSAETMQLLADPNPLTALRPQHLIQSEQSETRPLALERWLIQAHAFRQEVAADVGLLGRLFSANTKAIKAGVIHEAKRFSLVKSRTGRMIEVGTAVRLSVATASIDSALELTLPNLAASAQLSNHDTRVGITVVGYSGPLGDLLPAPGRLDVESCVEYLKAFDSIQSTIFGKEGWVDIVPTPLSFTNAQTTKVSSKKTISKKK